MKVLWFTNVVLPEFAERLGRPRLNQGGWLPSLVEGVREFAPGIELTVVCEGLPSEPVMIDGVRYLAIRRDCESVGQLIRDSRPDIVHVHGTEGSWAAVPKGVWRGCPAVASLQGILSACHPHYGGALHFSEVRSIWNLPNILLTRHTVRRAANVWRERMAKEEAAAFGAFDAFLGRTEWDKAWTAYLAGAAPGAKPPRYFHVGELLRAPFSRGGRTEATVVPHRIYCGAAFAYPLKGGHWLLRAVAALKRKHPDVRLRVANAAKARPVRGLVAFLRQGEYHRYLAKLIRELDLADNVDLLPSLSAEQVAEELRTCEVFCLPSLCENSPNSLGEAMLMGVPCVATDVGGVQTILKNGEQGILVPSADPAVLSFQIDRLFSDPALAQGYAAAARREARARHDAARVVRELTDAYREIAGT